MYGIGTATFTWTDANRREILGPDPAAPRRIVAQLWYPSRTDTAHGVPYVDDGPALSANLTRLLSAAGPVKIPSSALSHLESVRTHAAASAPPADGAFPVILFSSGVSGFRQSNMAQVEELVSHGFVVVGVDQPYVSASVTLDDGTTVPGLPKPAIQPSIAQSLDAPKSGIIPYLAQDLSLAIDEITRLNRDDPLLLGHLDTSRIGAFGVSLGAMNVAQACHDDPRLGACLMVDAAMPADVVADGLARPALWITRPASDMRRERRRTGGWTEHDIDQLFSSVRATIDKSTGPTRIEHIPGMFHTDFTDVPYYLRFGTMLGITGPAGRAGNRQLTAMCLGFFQDRLRQPGLPGR